MAKMTIITHHGRIRGVFTQKKKLWEVIGLNELAKDLMIAVTEVKFSELTYSKMCKHLKERGVLQIYDSAEVGPDMEASDVKSSYILWDIDTNTFYDPKLPDEDEDEIMDESIENIDNDVVLEVPGDLIKKQDNEPQFAESEKSREKFSI